MREILFRGKSEPYGDWVEGFYYKAKFLITDKELCDYITIPHPEKEGRRSDHILVISETIGQYTGLTDKNGKKIFEGDIINIEYDETVVENAVVEYVGASFYGSTDYDNWELDGYYEIEVIGNIHDNPELLSN